MKFRPATKEDLDGYLAVQEQEWGDSMAAGRAQLESRLDVFPDGVLVGEHDGQILAGATFIQLESYDINDGLSWQDLTTDGWCTNHVDGGSVLFGVDLSVSRYAPRSSSASLFAAAMNLAVHNGVTAVYWGARLPRYHRHADQMTPNEYLFAQNQRGRYLDPEVQLYSRIPFVDVVGAVPDYFKDWESANWGAIFRWRNPVHRFPLVGRFSNIVVASIYAADRRRRAAQRGLRWKR